MQACLVCVVVSCSFYLHVFFFASHLLPTDSMVAMVKRAVLTTGLATLVSGQSPTSISGSVATSVQAVVSPSATQPCAAVSSLQAAAAASGSSRSLRIPASLGHQCLLSVPVDKNGDVQLIDELKLYLQWNTDTAYLSNLPDWVSFGVINFFFQVRDHCAIVACDH